MEIKNLKKAGQRILAAVKGKEKIILYGDADVDGATSVAILKESIAVLDSSKKPLIYFIDREKEGYGINKKALAFLKNKVNDEALLVALDCGIGNVEEVELAKRMGMEVMIIDHHQVLKLPKASIIVDPKREDDPYPFKGLATVGLAYKLARVLLKEDWDSWDSFLELVALGTVADMMPLKEDNKELVKKGLEALNRTKRKGLEVLIALTDFERPATVEKIQTELLPLLNSSKTKNHLSQSFLLIEEESTEKAEEIVRSLRKNSRESRRKMQEMFEEISLKASLEEPIVFEGHSSWPLTLTGAVASQICRKFEKPTFIFRKGKRWSRGGVRVPKGIDSVKAMSSCKDLLKTYGGHAQASGFTIATKNLEKFKKCLIEYFEKL